MGRAFMPPSSFKIKLIQHLDGQEATKALWADVVALTVETPYTKLSMKTFVLFCALLALSAAPFATLAQQGTAPDFTVTDINGNTHELYADILDQGKIAVVQIVATWCPPCLICTPRAHCRSCMRRLARMGRTSSG